MCMTDVRPVDKEEVIGYKVVVKCDYGYLSPYMFEELSELNIECVAYSSIGYRFEENYLPAFHCYVDKDVAIKDALSWPDDLDDEYCVVKVRLRENIVIGTAYYQYNGEEEYADGYAGKRMTILEEVKINA